MVVFEYNDYKSWVNDWVSTQPKNGYGVYSRMAEVLGINAVVISQTFKAERELSLEHAVKLSKFMELDVLQTDYFLLLVQFGRASSHDLKQILSRQMLDLRTRGQAIKNRIKHDQLTDDDKATFYSNWLYISVWLGATIPEQGTVRALATRFKVSESAVKEALRFLLDKGLLVRKGQRFDFGKNVVHVPHDSPFVTKHHTNWRLKALQQMDEKRAADLFYTAPISMSHDLKQKLRDEIVQLIQKTTKRVADSPSETLTCLNIDFFDF